MPQKEVEFNGIFYWELEQKDFFQIFFECPKALMFDTENSITFVGTEIILCLGKKECQTNYPFISKDGRCFRHAVLLSSKHEKKSRRATNIEVMKWCSTNGVWLDEYNQVRNDPLDANLSELKNPCKKCVVKVVKWDGEPMEPTAQNMGLPE